LARTIYDEVVLYKQKAEEALAKRNYELAYRYLYMALERLRWLERRSPEPLKKIWREAIDQIQGALMNIRVGTPPQLTPIPGAPIEMQPVPPSPQKPIKIPQECKKDFLTTERPNVSFKDLAGMDELKQVFIENIEWPLKYPEKFRKLGLPPIKGLLLHGPPGCGKTFLVKVAAGEFNIPLITASPAVILSKYLGEAEKKIRELFECAYRMSPCIVFIDEVDKLLPAESHGTDAIKRVEAQILQELDGVRAKSGYIFIMATNEPWNLNPALIRMGRVSQYVYVPPPNAEVRRKLFELYLRDAPLHSSVSIDELVRLTEPNKQGYYASSGIKEICLEAKRELNRLWIKYNREDIPLTQEMLIKAIKKVPRTIPHSMVKKYVEWQKNFGS